jgi:hypothetical protein
MQMVAFWPLPWALIEARQSTAAGLVNSYHNGQSRTSVDLIHAIDLLIFHFQFVLNNTELVCSLSQLWSHFLNSSTSS